MVNISRSRRKHENKGVKEFRKLVKKRGDTAVAIIEMRVKISGDSLVIGE